MLRRSLYQVVLLTPEKSLAASRLRPTVGGFPTEIKALN
jgi:hypothetical protein